MSQNDHLDILKKVEHQGGRLFRKPSEFQFGTFKIIEDGRKVILVGWHKIKKQMVKVLEVNNVGERRSRK